MHTNIRWAGLLLPEMTMLGTFTHADCTAKKRKSFSCAITRTYTHLIIWNHYCKTVSMTANKYKHNLFTLFFHLLYKLSTASLELSQWYKMWVFALIPFSSLLETLVPKTALMHVHSHTKPTRNQWCRQREKGKQMAGLQRLWSQGYWQDAELEKLTFRGLYTAAAIGSGWIARRPLFLTPTAVFRVNLFAEVVSSFSSRFKSFTSLFFSLSPSFHWGIY